MSRTPVLLLLLVLSLSVCAQNNKDTLNSSDLLKVPEEVKGEFKVATNPPKVEVILFSGLPQEDKDALWSSWGNGCFASNGKYYLAIGDHRGYGGNSYVYEYDPSAHSLKKIVDVAQAIGQKKGDYGHGKIHTQIHEYKGSLYFATYWGKPKDVPEAVKKGYKGSLFLRFDLRTQKVENLGAISPGDGLPGSCFDPNRGLIYFYAVEKGDILVYDLNKRAVKFKGGAEFTAEHRWFLLAKDGKVWFADESGRLSFYDPDENSISRTSLVLPGKKNTLRSAARPMADGRIFGMTKAGILFELNPAKRILKDLGPNFLSGDYTAVMVLSPDEKYIYFAPGAHGSATHVGTPVIQYQVSNGARKVIAFLRDPVIQKANYLIGGSYNMQIDAKGAVLYCAFNGEKFAGDKKRKPFGLPSFVSIAIPEAERK